MLSSPHLQLLTLYVDDVWVYDILVALSLMEERLALRSFSTDQIFACSLVLYPVSCFVEKQIYTVMTVHKADYIKAV